MNLERSDTEPKVPSLNVPDPDLKKRRNLDLKHKYTCYNAKSYYLVFLINNGVPQIHGADGCEHRRLEKANIGIHFGRNFLVNIVVFGVIFTIRTHFTNSFLV